MTKKNSRTSKTAWNDAAYPPEAFRQLLIYGTLESEPIPRTHEGYWTGKKWNSTRSWGIGVHGSGIMTIKAIEWADMPTPKGGGE